MLVGADAQAVKPVGNGEDPMKGWALPHRAKLSFLPGPRDRAGPDNHTGIIIFSSIKLLFFFFENSLRCYILKGLTIVNFQYILIFITHSLLS